MAVSRYKNSAVIDNKHLATFDSPQIDLSAIATFSIRITDSDRLDILAFKHLGDGNLWWVIAELNDLSWPWDFASGQIIKIPIDVNEVLKYF